MHRADACPSHPYRHRHLKCGPMRSWAARWFQPHAAASNAGRDPVPPQGQGHGDRCLLELQGESFSGCTVLGGGAQRAGWTAAPAQPARPARPQPPCDRAAPRLHRHPTLSMLPPLAFATNTTFSRMNIHHTQLSMALMPALHELRKGQCRLSPEAVRATAVNHAETLRCAPCVSWQQGSCQAHPAHPGTAPPAPDLLEGSATAPAAVTARLRQRCARSMWCHRPMLLHPLQPHSMPLVAQTKCTCGCSFAAAQAAATLSFC